jgi:hypothetical protein
MKIPKFILIIILFVKLIIGYALYENNSYPSTTTALKSNFMITVGTILDKPLDIKFDYPYVCIISLKCDSNILKQDTSDLILKLLEDGVVLQKQHISLSANRIRKFSFIGKKKQKLSLVIESGKLTEQIKNISGYIVVDVDGGGPSKDIYFHKKSKRFLNYTLFTLMFICIVLFISLVIFFKKRW